MDNNSTNCTYTAVSYSFSHNFVIEYYKDSRSTYTHNIQLLLTVQCQNPVAFMGSIHTLPQLNATTYTRSQQITNDAAAEKVSWFYQPEMNGMFAVKIHAIVFLRNIVVMQLRAWIEK